MRPYLYDEEMAFLKKVSGSIKIVAEGSDIDDDEEEEAEGAQEEQTESNLVPAGDNDNEYDYNNSDDEWNADSKEGIVEVINQDLTINEIDKTVKRNDNHTSEDLADANMTSVPNQVQKNKNTIDIQEDRHLLFFKSVHPSLMSLDDDQTLEFQSGVINLLRNIKRGGRFNYVTSDQPCSSSSGGYTFCNQEQRQFRKNQ